MTRPSGASYAQFFPAAPRATRDRNTERERARVRAQESPSTRIADTSGHHTPLGSSPSRPDNSAVASVDLDQGSRPKSHANGVAADIAPPFSDDTESFVETVNTVGSASSHASSSSSLYGGATHHNAVAAMRNSNNYLTPLTTLDSPSSSLTVAAPPKAQSITPKYNDEPNGIYDENNGALAQNIDRIPARDPGRSIKCVKSTYDPPLDQKNLNTDRKKPKLVQKEFGLVRAYIIIPIHRGEEGRHLCCELSG